MALIGVNINRENPAFTKQDFCIYMPQFTKFFFNTDTDPWEETSQGSLYWNKIYNIANNKIFYSIFGSDWEFAMSYCIAHYLTIIGNNLVLPSGSSLAEIAGGGSGTNGILSSVGVGGFSKSYDLGLTTVGTDDAKWWNSTKFGAALMALIKTKALPSIFVVTSNIVPGAN